MNSTSTTRVHHVTFLSPGTFVSEQTSKSIAEWDSRAAVAMAEGIVERYGATPYAFFFTTSIAADPVPDGEGGTLAVAPKEIARSGLHFIGGTALTIEDIRARADPKNSILLSNMRWNDFPIVCEVVRGYLSTTPFRAEDVIVGTDGTITDRGDTADRIAYRAAHEARRSAA